MSLEQNIPPHRQKTVKPFLFQCLREGLILVTSRKLKDYSAFGWFHVNNRQETTQQGPFGYHGVKPCKNTVPYFTTEREPGRKWATSSWSPCLEYAVSSARELPHINVTSYAASSMHTLIVLTKNTQKTGKALRKYNHWKLPRTGKWMKCCRIHFKHIIHTDSFSFIIYLHLSSDNTALTLSPRTLCMLQPVPPVTPSSWGVTTASAPWLLFRALQSWLHGLLLTLLPPIWSSPSCHQLRTLPLRYLQREGHMVTCGWCTNLYAIGLW